MLRILYFSLVVLFLSACSKEPVVVVAPQEQQQEQSKKPIDINFEPTILPPKSSYKNPKF